tara:strand:+ start:185 stop:451 length:267 start_codon:yes stop_codon:yes gene_type:complete
VIDKMDTEKIVLDYVNSKSNISGKSKNEQLNYDYLSSGSIDSMQMVEMIEFLESKFKIRFNSEDFKLNKFRLVGGLIEIIKKHLQDKN